MLRTMFSLHLKANVFCKTGRLIDRKVQLPRTLEHFNLNMRTENRNKFYICLE